MSNCGTDYSQSEDGIKSDGIAMQAIEMRKLKKRRKEHRTSCDEKQYHCEAKNFPTYLILADQY